MIPTRDGHFIIAGDWDNQAFLLKVNAQGQQVAFQRYGAAIGGQFSALYDLTETSDGNFVAVGECKLCNLPADSLTKTILLEVNAQLQLNTSIGVKKLGAIGTSRNERFSPRIAPKGEGFMLVTALATGNRLNPHDVVISELSPSLETVWEKIHHNGFFEAPYRILSVGTDYFVLINRAFTPQVLLLKVGADGAERWKKSITANVARGLAYLPGSNRVVVLGDRTTPDKAEQAFLIQFDAFDGNRKDSLLMGEDKADYGFDVQVAPDENLLVALRSTRPGINAIASNIYRVESAPMQVRCFDWIPNPDNITSMSVTGVVPLPTSSRDFIAVGIRGLVNRAFFHKRQGCGSVTVEAFVCNGQTYTLPNGTIVSAPGAYEVVIPAANGCDSLIQITLTATNIVLGSATITDVTATQGGTISLSATGGTPPYQYTWSNGATGAILTGLMAGTYTTTVRDANGCEADFMFTIKSNEVFLYRETYGILGENTHRLHKILRLPDGAFLAGGQAQQRAFLGKVNCGGTFTASADLSALLPDSAVILDILALPDGKFIAAGECRHTVDGARRNRVFAFKLDADLHIDMSIGLRLYQPVSSPQHGAYNPDLEPYGSGFALAFNDDFFGGNAELLVLDAQLNTLNGQLHNFSFIEHSTAIATVNSSIYLAENNYIFGEPNKISVSSFNDTNGDVKPELIWEKKHLGAVGKLVRLPNGNLLVAGWRNKLVQGQARDALLVMRLRAADGAVLDSLLLEQAGADLHTADLQLLDNGSVLLAATYANAAFDFPQASPVYEIHVLPKLNIANTYYASGKDEPSVFHLLSLAPTSADGAYFAAVGWRGEPMPRAHFFARTDSPCAQTKAPLHDFAPCAPDALTKVECTAGAYCQPHVINNKVYANATDVHGNAVSLDMDIYIPRSIHDNPGNTQKRPLMVLAHGGGFVFGSEDVYGSAAVHFAQHGFIVASISYRLGVPNPDFCSNPPEEFARAAYRAVQDARKAVQYLVDSAASYHIDTEKIYMHGFSAGAALSAATAFFDASDEVAWSSMLSGLGPLPPLAKPFGAIFPHGGVGALGVDLFDAGEMTPVYAIHGSCDSTAPFDVGPIICPQWPASPGTVKAAQQLQQNGTPLVFNVYLGAGHGLDYTREIELYGIIRNFIKARIICGQPPQVLCIQTPYDLSRPCAMVAPCNMLVAANDRLANADALQIVPNPAQGLVRLVLPSNFPSHSRISIIDINGRTVFEQEGEPENALLDLSALPPGLYMCRMSAGGRFAAGKFVLN